MILQSILEPIITIFINNLDIFTLANSRIIKQIKDELVGNFDIVDIALLISYISFKVIYNQKQKKLSYYSLLILKNYLSNIFY